MDIGLDGSLYIANVTSNTIHRYTSGGTYLGQIGAGTGTGNMQFEHPCGVAVDKLGYVYVSDHFGSQVQKFTSSGSFQSRWGSSGSENGQFIEPWDLMTDDDLNLYVADKSNYRIQIFKPVN